MLLDHCLTLFRREACKGEHADLSGDVRPVSRHVQALKSTPELLAHTIHPVADGDELVKPLLTHLGVIKYFGGYPGSVLGRRRVIGSDTDLNLREDPLG